MRALPVRGDRRRQALAVVVPGLLMVAVGLWGLGRDSLFGSEADTYWAAQLPPGQLFGLLRHVDAVHGTYYLFMHAWLSPGASLTWLRLPSVAGMVVAACVLSHLVIRLTGRAGIGLTAGLIFAGTPSIATWAQNGRSYALVVGAVAVTTLALVRVVQAEASDRTTPRRLWVLYGILTSFTGFLHEFTLLLVPAFGVSLLWVGVARPVLKRWLLTVAIAAASVAPLVLVSATQRAAVAHLRPPQLSSLRVLFGQLFGSNTVVAVMLAAFAAFGALPVLRARGGGRLTAAALGVPMLVIPAAVLLIESRIGRPYYDVRYVLYSTLAAALLAACGVWRSAQLVARLVAAIGRPGRRRTTRVALACAVSVCAVTALVQWPEQRHLRTVASRGEDFGGAARYVARQHASGDAVVFMTAGARNAQLGFPEQFEGLRDVASAVPPARAGTFRGINKSAPAAIAAVRASDRVCVLGQYPLRTDPHGLTGLASVLGREYSLVRVKRFTGVSVIILDRREQYEHDAGI